MADPNYRGEDYQADENLRHHGPAANRRCSDLLFLLIFLAFVGAVSYVMYLSFKEGKPEQLLNGVDGGG